MLLFSKTARVNRVYKIGISGFGESSEFDRTELSWADPGALIKKRYFESGWESRQAVAVWQYGSEGSMAVWQYGSMQYGSMHYGSMVQREYDSMAVKEVWQYSSEGIMAVWHYA